MKKILISSLAALLTGCVWFENPVTLGKARKDVYPHTGRQKPAEEVPDTSLHLYIAAVEYPDDYDWVRDTAHGTVGAKMLLFKDGECVMVLPTGDQARISTDPDTHHLIGGNLYTTWSDGKKTCIKCNGEDLFSYEGGESITGLLVRDGAVWTLGTKIRGQGYALRYNGSVLADNPQGTLIGSLYEDRGDICYAYGISIQAGNYTINKYFLADGGEEKEVSIPGDATAVFDIRRVNGITYATYLQKSISTGPILSTESGSRSLGAKETRALYPSWCEIMPWGDDILVKGWYTYSDGSTKYVLWNREGVYWNFSILFSIREVYADQRKQLAAVGYTKATGEAVLFLPNNGLMRFSTGEVLRLEGKAAAMLHDGHFYACLSGIGGADKLWIDNHPTDLTINGPVTAIAYQ